MNNPSQGMLDQPLTSTEIERLDDILMDLGNDDSLLGMSDLDGFFTAIVSAPNRIPAGKWYPLMWGGEEHEPTWDSEEAFEDFMTLLMRHQNSIVDTLNGNPEDYAPLFTTNETEKNGEIWVAEEWCYGYLLGASLWQGPELPEELQPYMGVIMLHGHDDHAQMLAEMTLEAHQETIEDVVLAVISLFHYWKELQVPPIEGRFVDVRDEPKVGRNEPCPCGSGKKYKKCCLH